MSAPQRRGSGEDGGRWMQGFGAELKSWRRTRRQSQLDLALAAEVSARHISFLETGRANPSRDMVLRLSAALLLSPEASNRLMSAAGHTPAYGARSLSDAEMVRLRRRSICWHRTRFGSRVK